MKNNRVIRPEWVPEAYRTLNTGSALNNAKIIHPLVAEKLKSSLQGMRQSPHKSGNNLRNR